jgi:hypothetical protein
MSTTLHIPVSCIPCLPAASPSKIDCVVLGDMLPDDLPGGRSIPVDGNGPAKAMAFDFAAEYVNSLVSTPTWSIQACDRPIDLAPHRRAAAEGDRVEGRSGGLGWVGAGRGERLG